ncbi:hypothetical protein PR003_g18554 [Phytophthora rubi]|uniref:Uncharacterized protein n=1 Tax=Phytophthora rubi TaxID=129364 RepID=A0A6A3KC95_9STRA|nr:hypothetical protein PR002_g17851 [Phytophthora rubi]KAE9004828.1 hypothetical protein PR001_g17612 [Phytophthora rubi]KAE9317127.1 hypothetical protein PR003_g18554 [Phytophthora rubi]
MCMMQLPMSLQLQGVVDARSVKIGLRMQRRARRLLAEQTSNDVSMSSTSVGLVPTVAARDAVVLTAEPTAACEHSAITTVCDDIDDVEAGEAEEAPSIPNPAIVPMNSGGDASAVAIEAGEREETSVNPM